MDAQPRDAEDDGLAHVFDQTNGVLGDRDDDAPPGEDGAKRPPTSFGVPPITSL